MTILKIRGKWKSQHVAILLPLDLYGFTGIVNDMRMKLTDDVLSKMFLSFRKKFFGEKNGYVVNTEG